MTGMLTCTLDDRRARGRAGRRIRLAALAMLALAPVTAVADEAADASGSSSAPAASASVTATASGAASEAASTDRGTSVDGDTPPVGAALTAALTELGSDDYHTRDRATARLLADNDLETSQLATLYARAQTLEQRHRLLNIARHHTIRRMRERIFEQAGDRGSVGVFHRAMTADALPGLSVNAIEIIRTMPGFPAYPQLRAGDRILAVDGQSLSQQDTSNDFQRAIQQHQRGDLITFTIDREGRRLDVRLRLASLEALRSVYDPATPALRLRSPFREQWTSVRQRLRDRGPSIEPLRVSVSEAE